MKAQVKNWKQFQHYKDRNPPWIRLHHSLLDNIEFNMLPPMACKVLFLVWLIASENTDGEFEYNPAKLAFRMRLPLDDVTTALEDLVDAGFILLGEQTEAREDDRPLARRIAESNGFGSRHISDKTKRDVWMRDSGKCCLCGSESNIEYDHKTPVSLGGNSEESNVWLLCRSCNRKKRTKTAEQVATPAQPRLGMRTTEAETEAYTAEREKHVPQAARFDEFWSAYPIKRGKKTARDKWKAKKLDAVADRLIADVRKRIVADQQWRDGFAPHASTYLHQERWEDELAGRNIDAKPQPPKPSSHAIVKPTPTSLTPEQCEANQARLKSLLGGLSECQ